MLQTLGGLNYGEFRRVKPLLLLTFLALEGQTPRRQLMELLWQGTQQPASSLRVAAYLLRGLGKDVVCGEDTLNTAITCDATKLLTLRGAAVLAAYPGPFLHGVNLEDVSAEFEDWVLEQRERLARHVQTELLACAEGAAPAQAAALAEQVYRLPGAATDLPTLRRLLPLTLPGTPLETTVRGDLSVLELPQTTSLPLPTRVLGRSAELNALMAWASGEGGLATISGPGGIGKSTLGRELLRECAGLGRPVVFANAEGAASASELIARLLAQIAPGQAVPDTLSGLRRVLEPQAVVLLDGLDALPGLAELLPELRAALPGVHWVLTLRRSLNLHDWAEGQDFHAVRLGGLECPPPDANWPDVAACAAIRLLVREGRRFRHDFAVTPHSAPLLSGLARRLHGHPLALTLAATWLREESLEAVHGRVMAADPSGLPGLDADRSALETVLARSWEVLSPNAQVALLRLSVCADLDPPDAPALGVPEAELDALLTDSLLQAPLPGSERLRLYPALEGLLRRQATQRPELLAEARAAHARHYLGVLTAHAPTSPQVTAELENIRLALDYAIGAGTQTTDGALFRLMAHYDASGRAHSGSEVFGHLCDHAEDCAAPASVQAAAQIGCMWLAHRARRLLDAQTLASRFLNGPLAHDPASRMKALNTLSNVRAEQGRHREAAELAEEAIRLAQELNEPGRRAGYLMNLLMALLKAGDIARVQALLPEAAPAIRETGWLGLQVNLLWLSLHLPSPDNLALAQQAQPLLQEARRGGDRLVAGMAELILCLALLRTGQPRRALEHTQTILREADQSERGDIPIAACFLASRALYALGRTPQARVQARTGLNWALEDSDVSCQHAGLLAVCEDLVQTRRTEVLELLRSMLADPRVTALDAAEAQALLERLELFPAATAAQSPAPPIPPEEATRRLLSWLANGS